MEFNPLISVIIPTYNREKYIKDSIESVFAQTYKNYELIVVDDGSIDNTRELVKSFGSSITYIYKNNGGVSSARNIGIREAKGKYIAFLDSDDLWYPEKLMRQVEFIKTSPEVSLLATEYVVIDEHGTLLRASNHAKELSGKREELLSKLLFSPPFLTSSLLVKKDVISGVGMFDENLKTAGDLDYIIRIVAKGYKVGIVQEPLVRYRHYKNGISKNLRSHENRLRVIEKFLQNHPSYEKENIKLLRSALGKVYIKYGKTLLHEGYCKEAIRKFILSFKYKMSFEATRLSLKAMMKEVLPRKFVELYKNMK